MLVVDNDEIYLHRHYFAIFVKRLTYIAIFEYNLIYQLLIYTFILF